MSRTERCGVGIRYAKADMAQLAPETLEAISAARKAGKWMYFCGPYGTGKTHILAALAKAFFLDRRPVQLVFVPDFLGRMRSALGRRERDPEEILAELCKVRVLLLDDLGSEHETDWTSEALDRLINSRYTDSRPTIASGNLTLTAMMARLPRVASRLREAAAVIPLVQVRDERGGA